MFREDYRKLEKILCEMDSDEYVFHCMKTDVDYVNYFGKFRKKQGRLQSTSKRYRYYKWAGIGFDIFAIEKTNYLAARLSKTFYSPVQKLTRNIGISWIRKPLIRLIEFINTYVFHPLFLLCRQLLPGPHSCR